MGSTGGAVKRAEVPVNQQRRCPRCGSTRLYPSHRRGSGEKLLAAIGGGLKRCHSCRARTCWFGLMSIRLGENAKEGSLSSGVAVVAGCMVCIALLLWVITRLNQTN